MANGNNQITPSLFDEQEEIATSRLEEEEEEPIQVGQSQATPALDDVPEEQESSPALDDAPQVQPALDDEPEEQSPRIFRRPDQSNISPWDFSERAIGEPWKRGFKNVTTFGAQAGQMLADWRQGIKENVQGGIEAIFGEGVAGDIAEFILLPEAKLGFDSVDAATKQIRQFSNSIHARPSNLPETKIQTFQDFLDNPSNALEFLEPNRIYQVFGENAPTTGGLLVATAVNPYIGGSMMIGLEGGEAHKSLKEWEERTGEDIPLAGEILTDLAVGSVAASLEYLGINRIAKVAKGVGNSTLSRTMMNTAMGALTEGVTEGGQELVQAAGQASYMGVIPDGLEERFIQSVYAGIVTGGGLSGGSALMGSIANPRPDDAVIDHFLDPADGGRLEPIFRVQKPGHDLEGQLVTLDQMDSIQDINTPWYQASRLEHEILNNLPDNLENKEMITRANMLLWDAAAQQYGYENLSDFVGQHDIRVKNARIEKGDLLQVEAFHGSPHDFDKFSTQHIGSGEGFQAFGWGLYFTESRGIAESYARKLGAPQNNAQRFAWKGKVYKSIPDFIGSVMPDAVEGMGPLGFSEVDLFFERVDSIIEDIVFRGFDGMGFVDTDGFNTAKQELLEQQQEELDTLRKSEERARREDLGDARLDEIAQSRNMIENLMRVTELFTPENMQLNHPGANVYKVTLHKGQDTSEYKWIPWRDEVSVENIRDIEDTFAKHERQARDRGNMDLVDKIKRARENFDEVVSGSGFPAGSRVYGALASAFNSDRLASIFLSDAGYSGTKYRADAGRSSSYNYVVFDDSIVTLEQKDVLFQSGGPNELLQSVGREEFQKMIDRINKNITENGIKVEEVVGNLPDGGLRPSVVADDGTMYVGEPGDIHAHIHARYELHDEATTYTSGFTNKTGKYISRADASRLTAIDQGRIGTEDLDAAAQMHFDMFTEGLLQMQGQTPKGAVNFEDGQVIIKFFNSADASTVLHEMAHIFRRFMPDNELRKAEQAFGVDEGANWTREQEEAFARKFEQWVAKGRSPTDQLADVFRRFREWLLDIYGNAIGRDLGGELSKDQINFFNQLFDSVNEDINGMPDGPQKTSVLGRWVEKVTDWLDIEGRFKRNGMAEVGFHLKNIYSTRAVYEQEGQDLVEKYYRHVKLYSEEDAKAVLLAEQLSKMEEIRQKPEDERTNVEKAALILRDYFDRSQAEYDLRGIDVGFKERLVAEINEQIRDLDGEQKERMEDLLRQLEQASDIAYVHIPFYQWFRDKMDKSPEEATRLLARMVSRQFIGVEATRHERTTPQIQDLIDEGLIAPDEISAKDIMQSYSRQKGKDFAFSNVLNAAVKEDAAIRVIGKEAPPEGYHRGIEGAPLFKDYFVRDILHFYVRDQVQKTEELGRIRKWINISKMAAFWNPLFLPMYDVIQANMAGAMNILRPIRSARQILDAFSSVMNMDESFWLAEENGISSKPFNDPLATSDLAMDIAARTRHTSESGTFGKTASFVLARGEAAFADWLESIPKSLSRDELKKLFTEIGTIRPLIRNIYEASWATAWFLDRTIRQVSFNHFSEQGFSPRESAQKAAQAHGDYASVPPKTRRNLNSVFFTPTFKIAMGKWMLNSIRSLGNVLQGEATISQKDAAKVFIKGVAILGAFDMLMLSFDFDRDEWGRRYSKVVDTNSGPKEMVINWTGPHNLFLKYLQRVEEAMAPEVPNALQRAYSIMEWEITPLWRTATQIFQNDKGMGERIYYVGDDPLIKTAKMLQYGSLEIIQLLKQMSEEGQFGEEGAEQFAKEYGQFLEFVTAPFLFKYTRETAPQRLQSKLQSLLSIHAEEVEGARLANEMLRAGNDPNEVVQDYLHGRGVFSSTAAERSENLVRRMQQLIWDYETEHYDIWGDRQSSQSQDEPALE